MHDGIKQTIGPMQNKTASLKSSSGEVIQNRAKQMERLVEYYSELYPRQNVVTEAVLNVIEYLTTSEELDSGPILEELSKALDALATRRPRKRRHCP